VCHSCDWLVVFLRCEAFFPKLVWCFIIVVVGSSEGWDKAINRVTWSLLYTYSTLSVRICWFLCCFDFRFQLRLLCEDEASSFDVFSTILFHDAISVPLYSSLSFPLILMADSFVFCWLMANSFAFCWTMRLAPLMCGLMRPCHRPWYLGGKVSR
jgi:hypothetical protein